MHLFQISKLCFLVLLASSSLWVGCAEDHENALGTTSRPIIHGDAAHDDLYGAVAALSILEKGKYHTYCSGVLIDETHILTATHCIYDNVNEFPFSSLYLNNQIIVSFGENAEHPDPDHIFELGPIFPHYGYDQRIFLHDIGLITLKTPVPETIARPIPYISDSQAILDIQEHYGSIEFVGYGIDEDKKDSQRLVYEGYIDYYCQRGIERSRACDTTNDLGERLSVPENSIMHSLEKGGPCSGDSGGAVLADINGTKQLIGIISSGDGDCKVYSISTSVPDHIEWIEETLHPTPKEDGCSSIPQRNSKSPFSLILLSFWLWLIRIFFERKRPLLIFISKHVCKPTKQ